MLHFYFEAKSGRAFILKETITSPVKGAETTTLASVLRFVYCLFQSEETKPEKTGTTKVYRGVHETLPHVYRSVIQIIRVCRKKRVLAICLMKLAFS